MTTQTIDVTGLPEAVVQHLRALVDSIRGDTPQAVVPAPRTPEERLAYFNRLMDHHAVAGVVVDDSRESFYEGRE
jgi:hypothetical protein